MAADRFAAAKVESRYTFNPAAFGASEAAIAALPGPAPKN